MTAAARAAAGYADGSRFMREAIAEFPAASAADLQRIADAKRRLWVDSFVQAGVRARQAKAAARQAEAAAVAARRAARRAGAAADAVAAAADGIAG